MLSSLSVSLSYRGAMATFGTDGAPPLLVPVISPPALYPRLYPYVYTTLIPRSRHSFLSALPRNQTSPPNAHYKFQNTHLPRAPPFYGCAFREQKGMLFSPQGR